MAVLAAAPARAAAPRTSGWQWTAQSIALGVTVKVGVLAAASAPVWTVTIDAPATSSLTVLDRLTVWTTVSAKPLSLRLERLPLVAVGGGQDEVGDCVGVADHRYV